VYHLATSKIGAWFGCILLILSTVSHTPPPADVEPTPATAEQINAAIDRGLQYLHNVVTRPDATTGYWNVEYPKATTAIAVLAFEIQGHLASGNQAKEP